MDRPLHVVSLHVSMLHDVMLRLGSMLTVHLPLLMLCRIMHHHYLVALGRMWQMLVLLMLGVRHCCVWCGVSVRHLWHALHGVLRVGISRRK
jgi:hypothetical protein